MKKIIFYISLLCLTTSILYSQVDGLYEDWPHWRGPSGNGIAAEGSNPPIAFSENNNLKWKMDIPGKGHATPVVWNNQLIVLSAVATDKDGKKPTSEDQGRRRGLSTTKIHQFVVMSLDAETGKVQWKTKVHETMPEESTHELSSWASGSPVTDGQFIYAYFGSRGLYCIDMKGKLIWQRDFPQMEKRKSFGEGSSPGISKDKVFLVRDHEGDSFIHAIDKKTGKDIWKLERDEPTSWSSPRIVEVNGKEQVIVSATGAIRAYDADNGDVIWHCTGLTLNVIPYPVIHNDIVFLMSGFRGNALIAVDLKQAKGDINGTDMIVWQHDQDTPYTPSPVLWDGYLYFLRSNNGILSCYNAETFEEVYSKERLEGIGNVYASPIGANNQLYFIGQKGKVYVVKKGSTLEILEKNTISGEYMSSPAIAGDNIYIRSYTTLYCFGK